MAKIQIIVPVYNAQEYLRQCFDSIINQTFTDWEVIAVDDCSRDLSADIIKEYMAKDARFRCITQETNGGVSKARNKALDMICAPYVAFLDSDDYWENTMLETLFNTAESNNCDVVQCRYVYDFPGGKQVIPRGAFSGDALLHNGNMKPVLMKMMTGINLNHVCMKLIRTSCISGIYFDSELKTAEDLKFSVNMFANVNTYAFKDKVLYHYRRSDTSLTGKGLSGAQKLYANRLVSREIVKLLHVWHMDNFFYRLLAYMRPYIIILSKIYRILREKIASK